MMGMKRRGMGRRQVLNLNDKQDSPRRTWQTKYQQICAEHNQNGNHSDSITSSTKSSMKVNPLSGLLGQYHSDSDTEDENKKDCDQLNSKVSDFLKEIQTIAPAECTTASPSSHVPQAAHGANVASVQKEETQEIAQHSLISWQECYDENSGYVYYWNMETNEVTWEMPAGYQSYMESVTANQERQWIQEQQQHMGLVSAQMIALQTVPAVVDTGPLVEKNRVALKAEESEVNCMKPSSVKKNKNKEIDSDDERIEMITSYGPASDDSDDDDDDDDDVPPPVKRKKALMGKPRPVTKNLGSSLTTAKRLESQVLRSSMQIGPQPEPIGPVFMEPLPSLEPKNLGAPGDEENCSTEKGSWSSAAASNREKSLSKKPHEIDNIESESKELYPAPDSSDDKSKDINDASMSVMNAPDIGPVANNDVKKKKEGPSKVEEVVQSEDIVIGSGTSTPVATTTEGESDDIESGETDEGVILSRLRSQARILKELGGEIPDEVQHLIDPTTTSSASPLVADDVIAQIEKEMPPDYQTSDKEKEVVQRKTIPSSNVSSVENSPKSSSFALIAGYGDDSDPEDEKRINKIPKQSEQTTGDMKLLLTVKDPKNKINTEQCLSIEAKDPSTDKCVNHPIESNGTILQGSGSVLKVPQSHSVLFPSAINVESTHATESNEHVTSGNVGATVDSLNLPDSTTNNKTFKRKKRLDLDGIYPTSTPKLSTSSITVTHSMEVKSEKPKTVNVSLATSVTPSTTVSYSTWNYYNVDPGSGERRGFGFQLNKHDALYVSSDTSCIEPNNVTDARKGTTRQKKGIINFVKAETLNPVAQEGNDDAKDNFSEGGTKISTQGEVKEEPESKEEDVFHQELDEMAQLIKEKVNFLGEGKEPVTPVQVMAIQIETLVSAWQVGALSRCYWSRWLTDTTAELAQLEQVAAPDGWACEWDRHFPGGYVFAIALRASLYLGLLCYFALSYAPFLIA